MAVRPLTIPLPSPAPSMIELAGRPPAGLRTASGLSREPGCRRPEQTTETAAEPENPVSTRLLGTLSRPPLGPSIGLGLITVTQPVEGRAERQPPSTHTPVTALSDVSDNRPFQSAALGEIR